MSHRYLAQNLMMNEAVPTCQHWSYPSAHPMEAMLDKEYFVSAYDRLRPGDTIRIVQMKDSNINLRSNVVIAFCDVLVVQSGKDGVYLFIGEITVIKDKPIPKPAPEKRVQWNPAKKKHEVFYGDDLVMTTDSKSLADNWQPVN